MKIINLILPWPPSVNQRLGFNKKGKIFLTKKVKKYYNDCYYLIRKQLNIPLKKYDNIFGVKLILYPPDKRKRDQDNILKCLFDAIQYSKLIKDDSQFKGLIIEYKSIIKNGKIEIILKEKK